MARRLILDTGVLVGAERREALHRLLEDDDDHAVAAITVAELWEGVEHADPAHRGARLAFVEEVLDAVRVEDYTAETAIAHGRLLAHTRRRGRPRGAHDLVIAATAVVTGRTVVTADRKASFADLPGVDVLPLDDRSTG